MPTNDNNGHETLTVSTAAVGLTIPSGTTLVILQVNDQPLRWRADGTDPTASAGHTQLAEDVFQLTVPEDISAFRAIRKGGTDSELDIIYFDRNP